MSGPEEPYRYLSLFAGGNTFRVLYLHTGAGNELLRGEFLEVPTTARSGFYALSYAWEDNTIMAELSVYGRSIGITASLNNALRRIRRETMCIALWVDALCINQTDRDEKSRQIPLMSHIYASSHCVLIYLGLEDEGSQMMRWLSDKTPTLRKVAKMGDGKRPRDGQALPLCRYSELGLPKRDDPAWEAIGSFMMRPWFRRIWVIQEATLAQTSLVICGERSLSWEELSLAIYVSFVLDLPISPEPRQKEGSVPLMTVGFMRVLRANTKRGKRYKLLQLLHKCRCASASDAHDYCYGLLALAEDGQNHSYKPNYHETVPETYMAYAKSFVADGDGVLTLYNAAGQTLQLPSWVPDWSHRDPRLLRLCPDPTAREYSTHIYSAATVKPPRIYLHPTLPNVLVVRGIFIDNLAEVTRLPQFPEIPDMDTAQTILARLSPSFWPPSNMQPDRYINEVHKISRIQAVATRVQSLKNLLNMSSSGNYPTGEDLETVLWKTLICNSSGIAHAKAPSEYSQLYQDFKLLSRLGILQVENLGAQDLLDTVRGIDPEKLSSNALSFVRLATTFWYGRAMARTKKGYVGQVLLRSQEGDRVFLPFGSAMPFILRNRKSDPERYEMIGEAYIHGIMNGELAHLFEDLQQEIFID